MGGGLCVVDLGLWPGCVGSCPRSSSETSDAAQCLVTGYFRACDPRGVLTSIYKDPAVPGGGQTPGAEGEKDTRQPGHVGVIFPSEIAERSGRIFLHLMLHCFVSLNLVFISKISRMLLTWLPAPGYFIFILWINMEPVSG